MILTLRALKLGDLLTAVPALRAIRRAYPGEEHVLAAPESFAPLVSLSGAIDRVVDMPGLRPLPADVNGATVAFNLHGAGPESTQLLEATRPKRLVAFRHPLIPATASQPSWDRTEHETARWCRLVGARGIRASASDLRLEVPAISSARSSDAVVLHPGASAPARRWPPRRWAAVARWLALDGCPIVITGSSEELGLAESVAQAAGLPADTVLAGRTSLLQLAQLVAGARAVISTDTGVAHLASAFGTPSVVLFGPTSPAHWGPPADGPHLVLWAGTVGDPHGQVVDTGLLKIGVQDVVEAFTRLPRREAASSEAGPAKVART